MLISGSLDMTVKLWNPSTLECLGTFDCLGDSVMDLEVVGDKWLLAVGTHAIRVWDLDSRQLYRVLDGARYVCMYLCMYVGTHAIRVWDLDSQQLYDIYVT